MGLFFATYSLSAQTILDLFKWLPDSVIPQLDQPSREYLVAVQTNDESIDFDNLKEMLYTFESVDIKTNYLKIISSEDFIEMFSWNISSGSKMIAIYKQECKSICNVERFDFFRFNGSEYEPLFFNDIMPNDIQLDFFKNDMLGSLNEMKSKGYKFSLLYTLPKKGKNIVVKFGNEETTDIYQKWLKGNRMELVWKSGVFEKGKVYWE